ncbi:MAG: SDR family NAD(P)-dependent oxidoreductase [Paracoccaceae bacterium]
MAKGERIWIIGASEGIGAALARQWAASGAQLILSARSASRLADLAGSLGPGHITLPLDVGDRKTLVSAASAIAATGPLDRVVHLAALYDPGCIADLDPERTERIVSVNLIGSLYVAQIAPALLRPGGQLALCGSVAGYFGLPRGQVYSATKAGVMNLAQSLRAELAGRLDVRLISPGFVDTRLTRRNEFWMPAMITAEAAAAAIISGLDRRRFEVHFPRRFTLLMKLLATMPNWAALAITERLAR